MLAGRRRRHARGVEAGQARRGRGQVETPGRRCARKAGRAAAANKTQARAGATQPGKAPRRAATPCSRSGAAVARTPKRGAATLARVRPTDSPKPSLGHAIGLHAVNDPLSLHSTVALVLDQGTGEVLFAKNALAVLPIASISKLMTAMVVLDAQLPMSEMLEISQADVDTERNTRSRLATGTRLSRGELLQLALMSSENRAAHALGRNYPAAWPASSSR